ncbi:arginine--tRNA ligase [Blautia hydrogenotrophica]|uniref:Arginine--tRNA ligase n=1 Tax=Blautia hydrogenotrophica (strain DSM 10507 / JCM 14656 / S5a33) TaxID=476272 RepID=C0CQ46_BLAHS|nr:arginine--tRNA ligase [Blautia hydrogenotrophica]EEG48134.1 arginine--tRNA ligase [Blautia hydrogenotrophica DSM 10507]MCT6797902.1 arginine--tRNA ligase [Blautia hydrogenotrophica]WPX84419.1 Arginine--tRNA ligase [Blautia hydrogenotrophica DSM 10507]
MEKMMDLLAQELSAAFEKAGYDSSYGRVTVSNRPDLCEYQCNGAMAGAKAYHKAPIVIAQDVVEKLSDSQVFSMAEAVKPGFINLKIKETFLSGYLQKMHTAQLLGAEKTQNPKTIIIDYGGPNVAKPLHVGHLRSAIIGESIKRMGRFLGHEMIGDVHLGDWGLQMGLIITELKHRQPELVYFDESYEGEYPKEAPFTIGELEEIYPAASAKSKGDESFREEALEATHLLQQGRPGYMALWNHIMRVSVTDLKKNYEKLNVTFDLWKKESDAQPYIPAMVEEMREKGYAYMDQGALVVDVKEETDTKEVPPCMILKSDGASLYTTTDLATIVEREKLFHPDEILYVVDKRQEMHFVQVFRCAKKTGLLPQETKLSFLGFGTMNGKDGKPFKTREGGVMRLEHLIEDINEEMFHKIVENRSVKDKDARQTAQIVGLSAIKYGDLSNQATKDYIFDIDRFTSFEGNTGPYILYTIVRIKSILNRYEQENKDTENGEILEAANESEKVLMLALTGFPAVVEGAFEEKAPHKVCSYIYELANAFNRFYHETKILSEEDERQKASWIQVLLLTRKVLETSIDLLGFSAPERM